MIGRAAPDGRDLLIRFVREVLGCGCPDEIVEQTVVDRSDRGEGGLDVGGRLLVRVLHSDDLDSLIDGFPETVRRLREERDRRGFHRLRIVLAHNAPEVVDEVLSEMLPLLGAADDKVHLHAVDVRELPSNLTR